MLPYAAPPKDVSLLTIHELRPLGNAFCSVPDVHQRPNSWSIKGAPKRELGGKVQIHEEK